MIRGNRWSIVFMSIMLAVFILGFELNTVKADGATITWTASGDGAWSTATNWDLGRVPATGDHVVIPAGVTVTISSDATIDMDSIDCGGTLSITGGTVTFSASINTNTLSISGGSATFNSPSLIAVTINHSGGSATFNSPDLSVNTINNSKGTANFESPTTGINLNAVNLSGADNSIINFDIPVTTAVLNITSTDYYYSCRLGGSGKITVTQSGTWQDGMQQDTGTTVIASTATVNIINKNYPHFICRNLENNGTVTTQNLCWLGSCPCTINNNGTFDFQGDYSWTKYGSDSNYNAVFNNNAGGVLKKSGGSGTGTATITAAVTNNGTVLVSENSGTLSVYIGNCNGDSNGSFQAESGATLNFASGSGTLSSASSISASNLNVSGGSVAFKCSSINVDTINISGGSATFNSPVLSVNTINNSKGTAYFQSPATGLNLSAVKLSGYSDSIIKFDIPVTTAVFDITTIYNHDSCRLDGSGKFTITQGGTWQGGMEGGSGTTVIASGATVTIAGSGSICHSVERILENNGTVNATQNFYWSGSCPCTINNNGIFDFQSDYSWTKYGSGSSYNAVFNNNAGGVLKKSGGSGTGTTTITATVKNNGTVLVLKNSGTLSIYAGDSDGNFQAESGATLTFAGGSATLSSASKISAPNLSVSGGSVNFNCSSITVDTINNSGGSATFNSAGLSVNIINNSKGTAYFQSPATGLNLSTIKLSGYSDSIIKFDIPVTTAVFDITTDYNHDSCRLDGSGNFNITQAGTWQGGMEGGSGTTVIASGATVTIAGSGSICHSVERILENNGTVNATQKFYWSGSCPCTINNNGIFDFQGDYSWTKYGSNSSYNAVFNNNAGGVLKKSKGSVTATISAAVTNNGTVLLQPGCGTICASTTYTQGSTGTLRLDVSGAAQATGYNQLQVSGQANLDGNLDINLLNSYVPAGTDSFTVMTYGSNSGTFNSITNAQGHTFTPTYNSKNLVLQINDPASFVSSAAISPASGGVGVAQNVTVAVTTANAFDGTDITANLLDPGNTVKSSTSGSISGNAASLTLTVPSTLPAGSYQVQVVLSGAANSPFNAGTYMVIPAVNSVSATNGTIIVTLNNTPSADPGIVDFILTQTINGGAASTVTTTAISASGAVVTLTVPQISATPIDQSVVCSVTYQGGTTVAAPAFTVAKATNYTITISPSPPLSAVTMGGSYSQVFTAAGGTGLFTYSLTGNLPSGLTFNNGTLSGSLKVPGYFVFTVTATDTNGVNGNQSYTLVVNSRIKLH